VTRTQPGIYLAGPLGFTDAGRAYHDHVVVERVRAAGYEPLDPWDLPADLLAAFLLPSAAPGRRAALAGANEAVGRRNARLIDDADAVLAILDGSDVDSGTAAEIGYAAAKGKPIVGLRTDTRVTGDNEASIVNLQVEWFVTSTGGLIVTTGIDDAITALAARVSPAR
jgi:nucleoside 2-deoxyribosyltransferase